ncbi:LuxR C-terminal-related transcriptional regulator [Salinibacterium sp. ZJ70]|uniref:LuxR C-terminal-related transcriptional regulator n=1 Tax=Salinibacterium sp. ZJ70 TaxID=2708084 RepID=UPI00174C2782|nr:LuxR C-terminal-related transcriptional regulator [Salinibacterium sp. ZJ70]
MLDVPFPRASAASLAHDDVNIEEKAPSVWELDSQAMPHPTPDVAAEAPDPWSGRFVPSEDPHHMAACAELAALVERGDTAEVAATIRAGWYRLIPGDYERVREILHRIPSSDRSTEPLILLLLAAVSLPSRLRRPNAVFYFGEALRAARAHAREGRLHEMDELLLLVTEAAIYRIMRIGNRAETAALRAARFLRSAGRVQLAAMPGASALYAQVARSLVFNGDTDGAVLILEDGLAISELTAPELSDNCDSLLAGILAMRGDLAEARRHVSAMRSRRADAMSREGYAGAYYVLAESILALERLDAEAAEQQMARLKIDRRTIENWVEIARVDAAIALLREGPGAAVAELARAAHLHPGSSQLPHFRAALAPARAVLELAQGNVARAEMMLRKERARQDTPEVTIALARVALTRNAPGVALQEIRNIDPTEVSPRAEVEMASIALAALLRVQGIASDGDRHFAVQQRAASSLGRSARQSGVRFEFGLLAQRDLDAVREALAMHGFDDVSDSLPRVSLIEETASLDALTERELVVFRLLVSGKSIPEIAAEQFLSAHTIKVQTRSIYKKLNVSSRDELSAFAFGHNLAL